MENSRSPEVKFLQSLLDQNVYILFMHGSIIMDGFKKTYTSFTIPEDQTIVSFTSPGEILLLNTPLTTYFTHNSNSRLQTLLPLMSVFDSSDLYGKADEIQWHLNHMHMIPAPQPLGWDVTESPREMLRDFASRPFRGGQSQFETIYRAGPGSDYPDMRFSSTDAEAKYMGLFHYSTAESDGQVGGGAKTSKQSTGTPNRVKRIHIPQTVKLSDIMEMLPSNSILFTISCASWKTELRYPGLGTIVSSAHPNNLDDGLRPALRAAESQVRENELNYKATHPLLSSKSSAGWETFHRLFRRVRIPILSFYLSSNESVTIPNYALRNNNNDNDEFQTAVGYYDPISTKNFQNADSGLVTWAAAAAPKPKTRRHRRRGRQTRRY